MSVDRIDFKGYRYRLSGKYYRRNVWGSNGPSNLHRAIWEDAHGAIPDGYHVHHKDGDTFNNELANLELVERSEHLRQHTLERRANGELTDPSEECRERAAEWHGSDEGREWHKDHGKACWKTRAWVECFCQFCGQAFMSPYPSRAKWCHNACKTMARRARVGEPNVGVRSDCHKPRVLSGKRNPL